MSLFQDTIGSKTNFTRINQDNTLTAENTFSGTVNLNGTVNGLSYEDVTIEDGDLTIAKTANLQTSLDLKADQTSISNIDNTSDANKPVSNATQTALNLKADQASISNVDNTSDANKPVSNATQTALDLKANQTSISNIDNTSDANKPVSNATQTALDLKANQTSISNIDNTSDANKPVSNATQTALDLKANQTSISNIDNTSDANKPVSNATQTALDLKANQTSISNIDNTSDANKPVSNATQTALDLKQNLLNTSDLFLDTSVANAVKLGVNISNPTSLAGSDSLIKVYHSVDCGLSLKTNMSDWDIKNRNDGHLTFYKGGSERLIITDTETTLKQGLTVKGAVVDMEALPTSAQTGTTKLWNNSGILNIGAGGSGGGGGGGSSILKEYFSRYCFGQTVTTTNGNITLPNITTAQNITGSILNGWVDLTGSEISYQPPTGSTIVEYELDFYATCPGNDSENGFQMSFSIDGTEQSITRAKCNLSNLIDGKRGQTRYKFKTIIEINGTTDADKGFLSTWASAKTLKLRVMRILDKDLRMHEVTTFYKENPLAVVNTIVAPNIKICAY
jgi:hypothetical protein